MLNVLLFLWSEASGPKGQFSEFYEFGPDDVLRLAAQIRANLTIPHRCVVITDFPATCFPSELVCIQLQPHFGELRALGGCWLRLKCFAPEMRELLGERWCWIDLDTVVTGNLDRLLGRSEKLVLFRSDSLVGQRWNGSFVLSGPGNEDIWTEFDPARTPAMIKSMRRGGPVGGPRGTDQSWLHVKRDLSTPHVTAADGVIHWAVRCTRYLPEHAVLVTFPGPYKPTSLRVAKISPWIGRYLEPMASAWETKPALDPRDRMTATRMRKAARQAVRQQRERNKAWMNRQTPA